MENKILEAITILNTKKNQNNMVDVQDENSLSL